MVNIIAGIASLSRRRKPMDEKRYRVECMPAIEHDSSGIFEHIFNSIDAANQGIEAMANLLLYIQDKTGLMDDWSNTFWIEQSIDGGPWEGVDEEEEANQGPSDDAKAAEKRAALLAKIPVLSKELPDSAGDYWYWGGDKKIAPGVVSVSSWCGEWWTDYSLIPNTGKVSDMGGWWAKCVPPELPGEDANDE
jgi:hypothetical protein